MYYCSDGSRVSEATIKRKLSEAYRKKYDGEPHPLCEGCGLVSAQGSAHIVPKAELKELHMTELIWNPIMFFPACHSCNSIAENPSSDDFKKLRNLDTILSVLAMYSLERLQKYFNSYENIK